MTQCLLAEQETMKCILVLPETPLNDEKAGGSRSILACIAKYPNTQCRKELWQGMISFNELYKLHLSVNTPKNV